MPTYEYVCTSCGHAWEAQQRITEDPLKSCPKCSADTAKRQVSGGNFILKGGGWYSDLYSSPKPKSEAPAAADKAPAGDKAPAADKSTKSEKPAAAGSGSGSGSGGGGSGTGGSGSGGSGST